MYISLISPTYLLTRYSLGAEVAKFVEKHFIEEIKKTDAYKAKNFRKALEDTFYKMDEVIATEFPLNSLEQRGCENCDEYRPEQAFSGPAIF